MHQINHMLPKLFENKKNPTILNQRDLAKVPPNITSIRRTPSLGINPSPITDHRSQTHHQSQTHHRNPSPIIDLKAITDHRSINPSITTALIKPINPTNPSTPIKNQTLHRPPPSKPTTTLASNHQEKPIKKTTTDLVVVDLEIHQPWQQSHHTNRQRRGRWRENREERGWVRPNKIVYLVLELCYSANLPLELHCSSIAKKIAILAFSIL